MYKCDLCNKSTEESHNLEPKTKAAGKKLQVCDHCLKTRFYLLSRNPHLQVSDNRHIWIDLADNLLELDDFKVIKTLLFAGQTETGEQIRHHMWQVFDSDNSCYCVIIERTKGRADLFDDDYDALVIRDEEFRLVGKSDLTEEEHIDTFGHFRKGEAEIVYSRKI